MNGWLRSEAEQRGAWRHQRVQDLRAARVAGLTAVTPVRPVAAPRSVAAPRPAAGCAEAA